ncbi:bifunctional phosphopantothenoylcysteine decarboxylase/phosphopantothenate--cysteine ligase CoaBC [Desulfonatronum sp. SC1]|uniref:bifunctional phosphopantothenoylcysteine decarboxylase/phosphopantothenate--cysteine ligase CoaBC n=1 Tax=Desulfonatronum sp. SC1 TaxID=2109626 RepID=UPI000D31835E|nr:bifunctional phosphopantothenoylcysteine decarboxylase/phosphopantothenate--cysteine ligase CoaBC [Desulfonatronum sp. SC1]PTN36530.1 bifunctional phosphopantothenoylcysteine decarboxylase/phosphopantothenate--cysteine ligase CoaBC [Desulfonatronum sp. SC1]
MTTSHTDFTGFAGKRLQLGVTGSVSAFRAVDIMRRLQRADVLVGVTLTAAAQEFIRPLQFRSLTPGPVYEGLFDSNQAEYAHLEPAQNAHLFLVAPSTANTLAKHACGIGDDLLSSQLFSFKGPIIHAPAMNPRIWSSSAVQANVSKLMERGVGIVSPETGVMACGETGEGRLADVEEIFLYALKGLMPQSLAGIRFLVNLGPTREYWDPVRVVTNDSSGTMGAAIALAAWLHGAEVSVVQGPTPHLWLPRFMPTTNVASARQMHQACLDLATGMDIICLTAAVSDYRPTVVQLNKAKKSTLGERVSLDLEQNPDILADIGRTRKDSQYIIGFAAETDDILHHAQRKLHEKRLDLIVANSLARSDSGFGTATNQVHVISRCGRRESWPILAKTEVAMRIIEWFLDHSA